MSLPAAKLGDKVLGQDVHIVLVPSSGGPVPTPMTLPFAGILVRGCVATVLIENKPAAVVGSVAQNLPPHVPPSGTFAKPPTNQGTVVKGSTTVLIGGKPAARTTDPVLTCADPMPTPNSKLLATGQVLIGG